MARSAGVAFARTPSLNDDPRFLAVLADVVREAAARPPRHRSWPTPPATRPADRRDPSGPTDRGGGRRQGSPGWPPPGSWWPRDGKTTRPEVVVFEARDRFGGKLRSAEFGGRRVDLAADAFLARRPEATELCGELGLTESWSR